ncbi:glycoside hydrolase family 43 protein [Pseudocercospora fijiensis CIRAD86]|uniref:Glycoside hydrolase family 43 protein n=1 Tax=Pseudocercospora fijiensis (strain CIRAD86) TaxID=383855 RepID=N1Q9Z8_PSEFD|nr:glycoside hydrolase family 43 protein [Pseudocercospora fijiensis CIRAD86]EME88611.1 glycoside hydrolase family 43 protein [Pseudocercospora fijiensis CIRAD86]
MLFKLLKSSALLVLLLYQNLCHAATYSNPLRPSGPDPDIVYHDGYYYLIATNQVDLTITRARTLEGLRNGETKQVYKDTDPSRCCTVWAPELHFLNNAWHIYYASSPSGSTHCTRSDRVVGGGSPWDMPYTYVGQVRPDFSIDGTILIANGQYYFVYACRPENEDVPDQSICIAPMTGVATTGARAVISRPDQSWEKDNFPNNEGPYALYNGSQIWLAYSVSSCFRTGYAIGLLTWTGGDPMQMSSWKKSAGPVFGSANGNYGPGHNSFFRSPDGKEQWMAYHSKNETTKDDCGQTRSVNAIKLNWYSDGSPDFGRPPPFGTLLAGPSGE